MRDNKGFLFTLSLYACVKFEADQTNTTAYFVFQYCIPYCHYMGITGDRGYVSQITYSIMC